MNDAALLVRQVSRATAMLRAGRYRFPIRVRIHPLDVALLARTYGKNGSAGFSQGMRLEHMVGVPVVEDCAVTRGQPVAEYDE